MLRSRPTTLVDTAQAANTFSSTPRSRVCVTDKQPHASHSHSLSNMIVNKHSLCFFPAPQQPPRITGKKFKGSMVHISWEYVQPQAHEASIDVYKVSVVLPSPPGKLQADTSPTLTHTSLCLLPGAVHVHWHLPKHFVHNQQKVHRASSAWRREISRAGPGTLRGGRRACCRNWNLR